MDYAMEYALMSDIYDSMGGGLYRLTPANEGFFGNIGAALKRFWRWFTGKIAQIIDNVKTFFANLKKKPAKPVSNPSTNSSKTMDSTKQPARIESTLEKECKELADFIDHKGAIGQRISDELYGTTHDFEQYMKAVKSNNTKDIASCSYELMDRVNSKGGKFIENARKCIEEIKDRVDGFDKESHAIYMHHIRNVASSRITATLKYLEDTKRSCDRVTPYVENIDNYDKFILGRPTAYGIEINQDINVDVRRDINDTMRFCNDMVKILTDYLRIVESLA